jgi:hypothetical protein
LSVVPPYMGQSGVAKFLGAGAGQAKVAMRLRATANPRSVANFMRPLGRIRVGVILEQVRKVVGDFRAG